MQIKSFLVGMDNARRSSQYDGKDNLNIIPKVEEVYKVLDLRDQGCPVLSSSPKEHDRLIKIATGGLDQSDLLYDLKVFHKYLNPLISNQTLTLFCCDVQHYWAGN